MMQGQPANITARSLTLDASHRQAVCLQASNIHAAPQKAEVPMEKAHSHMYRRHTSGACNTKQY